MKKLFHQNKAKLFMILAFLKWLVLLYIILWALFHFLSDYLIFYPPKPAGYTEKSFENNFLWIDQDKNHPKLAAYYLKANSDKIVLFSHGNATDIGYNLHFMQAINNQNLNVLAYDYQGYGLSNPKANPTEAKTYQDIQRAYDYIVNKLNYKPENIIIFGRSLGCAPSIDLAAKNKIGGLIIEAPFVSAYRVKTKFQFFYSDKYPNIKKIPQVTAPTLIIHGTQDPVIPIWHGKTIYNKLIKTNPSAKFYEVPNAGHDNIYILATKQYWDTITNFIKQL